MWKLYLKLALAGDEKKFALARKFCTNPAHADKVFLTHSWCTRARARVSVCVCAVTAFVRSLANRCFRTHEPACTSTAVSVVL